MIKIPVQYIRFPIIGEQFDESEILHETKLIKVKIKETALVLIDIWKGPQTPPGKSWHERAKIITQNKIKPTLEKARKTKLLIIHAPSTNIAKKYSQWQKLNRKLIFSPVPSHPINDWPPKKFVKKFRIEQHNERHGKNTINYYNKIHLERMIADEVEPLPDEYIVSTGDEMQEILKRHRILNLLYAGFSLNACLINHSEGILNMSRRGYRTILLRDCTTATETKKTVIELLQTKVFLEWIEMNGTGYTTTSNLFIDACKKALNK